MIRSRLHIGNVPRDSLNRQRFVGVIDVQPVIQEQAHAQKRKTALVGDHFNPRHLPNQSTRQV